MKSSKLEEEKISKDVRSLFRLENKGKKKKKLKKETIDTTIKDIRNLFRLVKENKAIEDRIFIVIRNLFEQEDIRNIFIFKKEYESN